MIIKRLPWDDPKHNVIGDIREFVMKARGMNPHPRAEKVDRAELELNEGLWKTIKEFDLTYLEIQSILIRQLAHFNKYALRRERHPEEPGKGADEL